MWHHIGLVEHIVREAIEIELHPNNMKTGFVWTSQETLLSVSLRNLQKMTPDPLGYAIIYSWNPLLRG
jgi:hypothetical protein